MNNNADANNSPMQPTSSNRPLKINYEATATNKFFTRNSLAYAVFFTFATVLQVVPVINSILGTQGWVDAGTCSILDKTWNEDGQRAEGVHVQHLQGTNQYRMISPLVYLYEGVEDNNNPDDSDFPFMIDEDGKMTVANGFYMDWWGYQMYYDDKYLGYCFVEQENNTYRITFLLQSNSQLYVGGYFEFTWDR